MSIQHMVQQQHRPSTRTYRLPAVLTRLLYSLQSTDYTTLGQRTLTTTTEQCCGKKSFIHRIAYSIT